MDTGLPAVGLHNGIECKEHLLSSVETKHSAQNMVATRQSPHCTQTQPVLTPEEFMPLCGRACSEVRCQPLNLGMAYTHPSSHASQLFALKHLHKAYHVPGTVLSILHILIYFLKQRYEPGTTTVAILQMRKLRTRKDK